MTPRIWHTQAARISKYHRPLTRWAAALFFSGIAIVVGLVAGAVPERAGALAAALVAASFGIMCLGMIEHWFKQPPAAVREQPLKFLAEWWGAVFFDVFLAFVTVGVAIGVMGLFRQ